MSPANENGSEPQWPGPDTRCWSWRQELNLQPTAYKAVALPLSYASGGSTV